MNFSHTNQPSRPLHPTRTCHSFTWWHPHTWTTNDTARKGPHHPHISTRYNVLCHTWMGTHCCVVSRTHTAHITHINFEKSQPPTNHQSSSSLCVIQITVTATIKAFRIDTKWGIKLVKDHLVSFMSLPIKNRGHWYVLWFVCVDQSMYVPYIDLPRHHSIFFAWRPMYNIFYDGLN